MTVDDSEESVDEGSSLESYSGSDLEDDDEPVVEVSSGKAAQLLERSLSLEDIPEKLPARDEAAAAAAKAEEEEEAAAAQAAKEEEEEEAAAAEKAEAAGVPAAARGNSDECIPGTMEEKVACAAETSPASPSPAKVCPDPPAYPIRT